MSRMNLFSKQGISIGIDLGTRNILCASLDKGIPTIIPNRWGHTLTPAVIAWDKDWLIGEDAVRFAIKGAPSVWWDVKRKVGSDFKAECGGKRYSAEDLLAVMLHFLREDAEAYLGDFVMSSVIAVPACFSLAQRQAVASAAETAGLREVRILNEPTAAALSYGKNGRFLVLDFGAGTVDISVVEGEEDTWQVLESVGSSEIGGYDFDVSLAEWLRDRLLIGPLSVSDAGWRVLVAEAEAIKIALSSCKNYSWQPPAFNGKDFQPIVVEREELERLMRFSIRRLTHTVQRLWENYAPDHLLLAGGSSRIPLLREMLEKSILKSDNLSFCAEEAIVFGAALYANGDKERLLLDVLSGEIGVSWNGRDEIVIPKAMPLPFIGRAFYVSSESERLSVRVFQHMGEEQQERVDLSCIDIENAKGQEVFVTCSLDEKGLLRVRVRYGERESEMPIMTTRHKIELDPLAENRKKLNELKLRLMPFEMQLSPRQQDRLHQVVRALEGLREEDSLLLAEELASEMENVFI